MTAIKIQQLLQLYFGFGEGDKIIFSKHQADSSSVALVNMALLVYTNMPGLTYVLGLKDAISSFCSDKGTQYTGSFLIII